MAFILRKPLFELRPDIFPPYFSDTERVIWNLFFKDNPNIMTLR